MSAHGSNVPLVLLAQIAGGVAFGVMFLWFELVAAIGTHFATNVVLMLLPFFT